MTGHDCAHLKSSVLTTRLVYAGTQRRRQCLDCGRRFTTLETVITPMRGPVPRQTHG